MRLNADFDRRAIMRPDEDAWVGSPEAGVERRMLDRIGDEVARATSVVRYRAGSSFPEHSHEGGEEFLVLEGVFSDEHRDYPAGTYVRNPPGTRHSPHSSDGCRILVKLRQFDPQDLMPVVLDTRATDAVRELHRYGSERVSMLQLARATESEWKVGEGGLEWFLVSGSLRLDGQNCEAETWLRFPAGDGFEAKALDDCVIWQKSGHLPGR